MHMDFLIRFVQVNESFRKLEIESIASLFEIPIEWVRYSDASPFAIIRLPSFSSASKLISRSVLAKSIHVLWGHGPDIPALHESIKTISSHEWPDFASRSYRYIVNDFGTSLPPSTRDEFFQSLSYLNLAGPIKLSHPDESFTLFVFAPPSSDDDGTSQHYYFGRHIGDSARHLVHEFSLKTRPYINTTSMDAELAFVTANFACVGEGKLCYDPFAGTGGFMVAAARFGGVAMGSDLDGRVVRGEGGDARKGAKMTAEKQRIRKQQQQQQASLEGGRAITEQQCAEPAQEPVFEKGKINIRSNFSHYNLQSHYLDTFISDLTNSPLRCPVGPSSPRYLDAILCDPPYGIREGLKVLGHKDPERHLHVNIIDGKASYLAEGFIPPKRPYALGALLEDILEFAALRLVDGGRLAMWVPEENEGGGEVEVREWEGMELVGGGVQRFAKWSRRLLAYRRIPGVVVHERQTRAMQVGNADDLNGFRKRYFEGFRAKGKGSQVAEVAKTVESTGPEGSTEEVISKMTIHAENLSITQQDNGKTIEPR